MAVPWLRLLDAAVGVTGLVRRVSRRASLSAGQVDRLAATGIGSRIEARLAGLVMAALKEAFDRDQQRLDLEREQIEAERRRAERALRLELARQVGDREANRLRLLASVAAGSLLATLLFSADLVGRAPNARLALGIGWLMLLAALANAFVAQGRVGRALDRLAQATTQAGGRNEAQRFFPAEEATDSILGSSGVPGAAASWLIVAGLAAIALGVLMA